MRNGVVFAALAMATLWPLESPAGGSWNPVTVLILQRSGETAYLLIVKPLPADAASGYVDPYMGTCSEFLVRGDFSNRWRRFGTRVTRDSHRAALEHLGAARDLNLVVNLGWMGGGFRRENSDRPCEVRSKALQLYFDEGKPVAVVSYHDRI